MSTKLAVFILFINCVLVKSIDVSEVKGSNNSTAREGKQLHIIKVIEYEDRGNAHRGPGPAAVPRIMSRSGGPGPNLRPGYNRYNQRPGPPPPRGINRRVQIGSSPINQFQMNPNSFPGSYKATRYVTAKNPFVGNGMGNKFNRGPPPPQPQQYRGPNPHYRAGPHAGGRFKPSPQFNGNVIVKPQYVLQQQRQPPQQQQSYQKPMQAYPQRQPQTFQEDSDNKKPEFQYPNPQRQPESFEIAVNNNEGQKTFYINQKPQIETQPKQQYRQPQVQMHFERPPQKATVRQGDVGYSVYEPETEENDRPVFAFPKTPNSITSEEVKRYLNFMGSKEYFLPKSQPDYRNIVSSPATPQQTTARPYYPKTADLSLQNYRVAPNAYLPKEKSQQTAAQKSFLTVPESERIEFTESDAIHSSYTNSPVRKYHPDQNVVMENTNRRYSKQPVEDDDNPNDEIMLATGSEATYSRQKFDNNPSMESPKPTSEQEDTEEYCERICSGVHDDDEEVICGSDGYMYTSEAQLECYASCLHIDVTIQGKGSCSQR